MKIITMSSTQFLVVLVTLLITIPLCVLMAVNSNVGVWEWYYDNVRGPALHRELPASVRDRAVSEV